MADLLDEKDETLLTHPGSPEAARHVNDYERFTRLMKWGAVACLVIGLISLMLVRAYW